MLRKSQSIRPKRRKSAKNKMKKTAKVSRGRAQTPRAHMTFEELLRVWQDSNSIRLKQGTINKYSSLIESQIIPKIGKLPVSQITTMQINNFLSTLSHSGRLDGTGGLSPSYIRTISYIISATISFGASEEMCQALTGKIQKPSIPKRELQILTHSEQEKIEAYVLNNLSPTGVGVMISLYAGLRIGEVCAISWDDVDLPNGLLAVRHTVSRIKAKNSVQKTELILDEPKTKTSKRIIPISPSLLAVLQKFKPLSKSRFVASDNENFISPRTYEDRFQRLLALNQVPAINYHSLRHTFATRCIEVGVDVKTLSEILGHADVSITLNTYVHSSIEMKKRQLAKLTPHPQIEVLKTGLKSPCIE